MVRFDKFQREHENGTAAAIPEPAPTTNGAVAHKEEPKDASSGPISPAKRKADSYSNEDPDGMSDVVDSPPPKKVKKTKPSSAETDEQLAKRMQAELNAPSARSTRGAGTKKKPTAKKDKKKSPKKKSKAKIGSDDDSDMESSEKPEKERKGGFHVRSTPSPSILGNR